MPASILPDDRIIFRRIHLSHDEIRALAAGHGVHTTRTWADLTQPPDAGGFRPAVPLKQGHIGSLISSGQIGVIQLGDQLAKGRSAKVEVAYDQNGNEVEPDDPAAVKLTEQIETRIFTLDAEGQHRTIRDVAQLEQFLTEHAAAIAGHLERLYKPRYEEPTAEEWAHVARLLPNKRLPGRQESGLLEAQKHVAIAAARTARHHGWVDEIGEMGVGKSVISLATASLLDRWPALVLCPGHLVKKWAREAEEAIPGIRTAIIENLADLVRFVDHYALGTPAVVVLSKERAKLGSGWQHALTTRLRRIYVEDDEGSPQLRLQRVPACPTCGTPLLDDDGALVQPGKKRLFCQGRARRWDASAGQWIERPCNQPLFEMSGLRRWPIADYIRKQLKGFFGVLIADEHHNFKGKSTDQAEAYHHLSLACRYTINLTGTLFGGKSTDLFWLRYRMDPAVRRDFAFQDETRWARLYGRLEMELNKLEEDEDGSFSGKRRYVVRTKELPGISPALFGRLLPTCIFVRISDLGFALPPYHEEIHRIPMAQAQAAQYQHLHGALLDHIKEGLIAHDGAGRAEARALLSVWLQNCLSRPNSGFRTEHVRWKNPETGRHEPYTGARWYDAKANAPLILPPTPFAPGLSTDP